MVVILIILVFLTAFLTAYGTFQMFCEFSGAPSRKASQSMLLADYPDAGMLRLLDVSISAICEALIQGLGLCLPENKNLSIVLEVAEIHTKQEVYILRPIVIFLLTFLGSIPLLTIHIALLLVGFIIAAFVALFSYRYAYQLAQRHRSALEIELCQFVQVASQCMTQHMNSKAFLQLYQSIAGKEWQQELALILRIDNKYSLEHMRDRIGRKTFIPIYEALLKEPEKAYPLLKSIHFQMEQVKQKTYRNHLNKNLLLSKWFLFLYLFISIALFFLYIYITL